MLSTAGVGVVTHPALVAAARFGLSHETAPARAEPTVVDPSDTVEVLSAAHFDRLDGLLALAVLDGQITGDDTFVASAADQHRQALRACVTLESFAVRTQVVLDDARIDARLLKGPALAHLDFENPAQRCFGDVDILIPAQQWEAAIATLVASGYRRDAPELRPGFERRFGKGATMLSPDGFELDLHRTFAIGRFGVASDSDTLFANADPLLLGGYQLKALSLPNRLLHACYHEAIGGFRGLRAARDVAQLILVSRADWRATVEVAGRWRASIVAAAGITDAWHLLGLDPRHPAYAWARRQQPTRAESAALQAFRLPLPFRRQALTALPAMNGVRSRATFLYALGIPSKASRDARQRSLAQHLWQSVRTLRPHRIEH